MLSDVSGTRMDEVLQENQRMKETLSVLKGVGTIVAVYVGIIVVGMAVSSKRAARESYSEGLRQGGETAYGQGFNAGFEAGTQHNETIVQ